MTTCFVSLSFILCVRKCVSWKWVDVYAIVCVWFRCSAEWVKCAMFAAAKSIVTGCERPCVCYSRKLWLFRTIKRWRRRLRRRQNGIIFLIDVRTNDKLKANHHSFSMSCFFADPMDRPRLLLGQVWKFASLRTYGFTTSARQDETCSIQLVGKLLDSMRPART